MFYGTLINLFANMLLESDMTNSNIDFSKGNISSANHNFVKTRANHDQKVV